MQEEDEIGHHHFAKSQDQMRRAAERTATITPSAGRPDLARGPDVARVCQEG
jgi:hypothetical protein